MYSKEKVAELVKQAGYIPIDISNYKNLKSEIIVTCQNGHQIKVSLYDLRKGYNCPKCEGGSLEFYCKDEPPIKKGFRVIGLDNATKNMGISVFDNGNLVHSNIIKFDGLLDDRLVKIYNELDYNIIRKWQPDFICFEDIQLQNNYNVFKTLAMLMGIIRTVARKNNVNFALVSSNVWRSQFNIRGKSRLLQKANAIEKVKEMYGIDVTDDEAEAILIGKYGTYMVNAPNKLF